MARKIERENSTKKARRSSSRPLENEDLRSDMWNFRNKALELGASAAEVIPASSVLIQERVWMKCLVPRCGRAGNNPNCPPNTPQPEFMRKVVGQYAWAVFFKRDISPVADYTQLSEKGTVDESVRKKARTFHDATWEIVGRLESYAQSCGYYLAMGFSAGSCQNTLCGGLPCEVSRNKICRHPLRSRPSMEAVGIDVFDLAEKAGWDTYMVRLTEPNPDAIPCAMSAGIVFVC